MTTPLNRTSDVELDQFPLESSPSEGSQQGRSVKTPDAESAKNIDWGRIAKIVASVAAIIIGVALIVLGASPLLGTSFILLGSGYLIKTFILPEIQKSNLAKAEAQASFLQQELLSLGDKLEVDQATFIPHPNSEKKGTLIYQTTDKKVVVEKTFEGHVNATLRIAGICKTISWKSLNKSTLIQSYAEGKLNLKIPNKFWRPASSIQEPTKTVVPPQAHSTSIELQDMRPKSS